MGCAGQAMLSKASPRSTRGSFLALRLGCEVRLRHSPECVGAAKEAGSPENV